MDTWSSACRKPLLMSRACIAGPSHSVCAVAACLPRLSHVAHRRITTTNAGALHWSPSLLIKPAVWSDDWSAQTQQVLVQSQAPPQSDHSLGWRTDFEDVYELGKPIGHGSFGTVRSFRISYELLVTKRSRKKNRYSCREIFPISVALLP